MSVKDSRRYFWLKLKDDFFDDDAIEWLEEQPNGKEYVLFYLKLCLKSLKHDCCLIRTVGNMLIPYDARKLGELTRTKEDTVIVALELLKRIGLVDLQENGALFMAKVSEMIGSETNAAARMRKTREKAKELGRVNNVRPMLQNCSPELEIEKEIEIDKELEKELESVSADTPTPPPKKPKKKFAPPTLEEVRAYIAEKNLDVDPQKFFDYYETGDWHDAKGNRVKNWKQKCLTWDKHDKGRQVTTQPQQVTTEPKDLIDSDVDWSKFDG